MGAADGFHPDFDIIEVEAVRARVHHIKSSDLDSSTAQTEGLRRLAAICGKSVGTQALWMGEAHVEPATASGNHHHGDCETAIYVRKGNPEFVFHDGVREVRIAAGPGDYIFVPPYVPHREENPDPTVPAEVVIARTTPEAVVVNLPALYSLGP
ncbi:cupin [Mycobacterium sp. 1554424.7]|nr:cupin [Mycobacterium sp. 1554424.7]